MELLHINDNSLSGTMPTQFGLLTEMYTLYLGDNSLSGTIPTQLGLLSKLVMLDFYDNSLDGTIPTQLGLLTKLVWLHLELNHLTGTPKTPDKLFSQCNKCPQSERKLKCLDCEGFPPRGCSAFGPSVVPSLHDFGGCVRCPESFAVTAALVVAVVILVPLGIHGYVKLIRRFPRYKGWIATSHIIISHTQVLAVLGSLKGIHDLAIAEARCARCSLLSGLTWPVSTHSALPHLVCLQRLPTGSCSRLCHLMHSARPHHGPHG